MTRRYFRKPGTTVEFEKYVPGEVILNSQSANWSSLEITEFSFPDFLGDGPAPGLPSHGLALLTEGAINGECSVNRGPWKRRHAEYPEFYMDFWPEGYEPNWRWWPVSEPGQSIKLATLYLKQGFLEKLAAEVIDVEPGRIELPNQLSVKDPFVSQLILAVRDELKRGNPCGPVYAETAAQMLALHLLSKHCAFNYRMKPCRGGLSKSQLRRILDYIDSHLHEEIALNELASLTGLTSYHFLRLFKRSTGETPLQFIIRSRMDRAKALLATGVSVTDVAMDVGYGSLSHFITLFKRHTGVTPLEYQKKL